MFSYVDTKFRHLVAGPATVRRSSAPTNLDATHMRGGYYAVLLSYDITNRNNKQSTEGKKLSLSIQDVWKVLNTALDPPGAGRS